ncbi:SIR2 family protein [Desulfomonile tiedjei]|uniref:Uncharacterized protein n=1 Tax=Desulfomonile tiedjei (strain ATCC 49306 / DSM 6799 / DCB-1) TaxID=706587 RepID=I4CAT7_DESTA|nr:SIR2 family protein [Desulfomonile tiedjei]AFM26678.1 hypothetical protein Desti_4038 [Desulfomonile tiedjei DSM 6799]
MLKRVSFLFGSGISLPAKMPSVDDITQSVLSGSGIMRHTNGRYYVDQSCCGIMAEYVERVVKFLTRLSVEIERYYNSKPYYNDTPPVNYEDLYYLALQILDSEMGEYDNPIVQPFVDKILPDISPLLGIDECETKWEFYKIAEEATNFISDTVCGLLESTKPTNLDYLNCVRDASCDLKTSFLEIFTLNHDTILESYLEKQNIEYTAGFEPPENGYHYWSPKAFSDSSHKVRLFKLHGSVNWFRYKPTAATGINDPVGIADDGRHWLIKSPSGELRRRYARNRGRPVLLVGTFNKMLEYTNRIFADLFFEFRRALSQTDLLIVSGYGFGDQGINAQVVEWMNSSKKKKIIVIHQDPDGLKWRSRGNVLTRWDDWVRDRQLATIEKWIEDTSWEDIQSRMAELRQYCARRTSRQRDSR